MKGDMMKWLLLAGGAFGAYWYITNYGPNGPVRNAAGLTIAPSWWDTWFGGAHGLPQTSAAPAVQNQVIQSTGGTPVQTTTYIPASNSTGTVMGTSTTTVPSAPAGTPVNIAPTPGTISSSMRDQLLKATGGVNSLNADQWNYYWTQIVGVLQTADLFTPGNRGELINVDTYLQRRSAAGLGAIIRVPSVASIPSMTFGGSLRRPGSMPIMSRSTGKPYLQ